MPATIWKFPLRAADTFAIEMPTNARLLHVGVQNEQACVWALVDPSAPKEQRRFRLYGTGHPIGADHPMAGDPLEGFDFVGTFQLQEGMMPLVFHLFGERKERN